jgi:hypothetical protein
MAEPTDPDDLEAIAEARDPDRPRIREVLY